MKSVFIVQGFTEMNTMSGTLTDLTTFEVYAKTEKEALKKAKSYVDKKNYRISRVIETERELKK